MKFKDAIFDQIVIKNPTKLKVDRHTTGVYDRIFQDIQIEITEEIKDIIHITGYNQDGKPFDINIDLYPQGDDKRIKVNIKFEHPHWIERDPAGYRCSECNYIVDSRTMFCPNCGVNMHEHV